MESMNDFEQAVLLRIEQLEAVTQEIALTVKKLREDIRDLNVVRHGFADLKNPMLGRW